MSVFSVYFYVSIIGKRLHGHYFHSPTDSLLVKRYSICLSCTMGINGNKLCTIIHFITQKDIDWIYLPESPFKGIGCPAELCPLLAALYSQKQNQLGVRNIHITHTELFQKHKFQIFSLHLTFLSNHNPLSVFTLTDKHTIQTPQQLLTQASYTSHYDDILYKNLSIRTETSQEIFSNIHYILSK